MQLLEWQERFNVGIEVLELAHRQLFSLVRRIMEQSPFLVPEECRQSFQEHYPEYSLLFGID